MSIDENDPFAPAVPSTGFPQPSVPPAPEPSIEDNIFEASRTATDPIKVNEDLTIGRDAPADEGEARAKADKALASGPSPMADTLSRSFRLAELSIDEQLALAVEAHQVHGKAAGHIPDFGELTENMKAAWMKIVKDIFLAADRKVRSFNE
jgi:hypothetical protein